MLKKISLSFVLFTLLFYTLAFPFAKSTKAAEETVTTWYSQSFKDWATKVFDSENEDEIFGERYTAAQVQWIFFSFIAHPMNYFLGNELFTCLIREDWSWDNCRDEAERHFLGFDIPLSQTQQSPELASPGFSEVIQGYVASNKLSGVGYVADSMRKLNVHLVPEASAQGFGYNVFPANNNIFRRLWSTSRDVAYFVVVLAVVYVSFLIMFRSKTSGQTAVTVQSALPKIVIALVLITFSYAIAGFMIDIMYVLIGLVATIVVSSQVVTSGWSNVFTFLTTGPYNYGMFGFFFYYAIMFAMAAFSAVFQVMFSPSLPAFVFGLMSAILLPVILLILMFVYFIAFFRAIFMIVRAYVNIVLYIIAAPLMIAAGVAFQGVGFGTWFNGMASNLLVFPVISVLAMLALVFAMAAGGFTTVIGQTIIDIINRIADFLPGGMSADWVIQWNPAYFGHIDNVGWAPPLSIGSYAQAGGGQNNYFLPLLLIVASLSILLLIPKAAEMVRSLMAKKPFAGGSAIGESLAATGAAAAATVAFGSRVGQAGTKIATFYRNRYGSNTPTSTGRPVIK